MTYHACRKVGRICRPRPCSGLGRRSLTRASGRSCEGERRERWKKKTLDGGNAIGGTCDGKRRRETGTDGAVDVGRSDGRRRCLCLSRVRGRSQSEGWENISFSGYLSLFYAGDPASRLH